MKKTLALLLLSALILTQAACSSGAAEPASLSTGGSGEISAAVDTGGSSPITASPISVEYDPDDLDPSESSSDLSYIELEGDTITFEGSGATVDGSVVTITSAGVYNVSGTLNDGQIVIDTQEKGTVQLVLDGADITCSSSAPIYVLNAEKAVITLADGTENRVTDGDSYILEDAESDEPNAAIFSKDDLTINGNGSLTVQANYNNGIASKDDLKITGGRITVTAVNDGIKGKDSIAVLDGIITINAGADGMQSHNEVDAEKGYIAIEGGTFDITAGLDGIQAETRLSISGGDVTISSGGGSVDSSGRADFQGGWGREANPIQDVSSDSTKGIKAGVDVTITGGTFQIDSLDDSLHSNDSLTISGGEFILSTGDDGIHADSALEIDGGDLTITRSYEGIESAVVTINGGNIHIVSSDDGINAPSEGGGDFGMGGRPGREEVSGNNHLYVNDGYIAIDAGGDGLDINGPIDMTGGVVIINGPTSNNNGALDYAGAFTISGGFLVAVGSAGMAQAPSASSTQYSVMLAFPSALPAQTMVHIATEDGQEILSFVPTKAYQSVVLCSPELENGASYVVYTGGSSTGTVVDGLYSGGTYTGGTQSDGFTISSMVTGAGAYGGGFPQGPGRPRP